MNATNPLLLRLVLWPSVLTLLISIARLVTQVEGMTPTASGGGGVLLGITWLVFVFGGWFGWRLSRAGSAPRVRRAWLWALLTFLLMAGTVAWRFSQVDRGDTSEAAFAALRVHVGIGAGVAVLMALLQFVLWPRLATVLLVYGLCARVPVVALTWLAKHNGWDTHYTKFGPAGIERDMTETVLSASLAQFGFWVPFTIVAGTVVGCLVGGRRRTS